jgi:hypothetical protein
MRVETTAKKLADLSVRELKQIHGTSEHAKVHPTCKVCTRLAAPVEVKTGKCRICNIQTTWDLCVRCSLDENFEAMRGFREEKTRKARIALAELKDKYPKAFTSSEGASGRLTGQKRACVFCGSEFAAYGIKFHQAHCKSNPAREGGDGGGKVPSKKAGNRGRRPGK